MWSRMRLCAAVAGRALVDLSKPVRPCSTSAGILLRGLRLAASASPSYFQTRAASTTGRTGTGNPDYNQPLAASEAPWPAGIASFMRLPIQSDAKGLDACFVGVPLDIGVTNRSGTRFGPRQIRQESIGIRPHNPAVDVSPFNGLQVADIGDVAFTMYHLPEALQQIRAEYEKIVSEGCIPLTMGGDHTITYPILQAVAQKHGPVAVVHVDAHTDTSELVWGSTGMHGTPFRRAVEESLVQPNAFFQIGLRGSTYEAGNYDWGIKQGFHVIPAKDCWHKSLTPLMAEVRTVMRNKPVYLSFDIDGIDPSFCPGTGTREVGGLTTIQAIEVVRGCRGLNLVGCDLVEVSPPYDMQGTTAHMAANLLFEMLCALPMKSS